MKSFGKRLKKYFLVIISNSQKILLRWWCPPWFLLMMILPQMIAGGRWGGGMDCNLFIMIIFMKDRTLSVIQQEKKLKKERWFMVQTRYGTSPAVPVDNDSNNDPFFHHMTLIIVFIFPTQDDDTNIIKTFFMRITSSCWNPSSSWSPSFSVFCPSTIAWLEREIKGGPEWMNTLREVEMPDSRLGYHHLSSVVITSSTHTSSSLPTWLNASCLWFQFPECQWIWMMVMLMTMMIHLLIMKNLCDAHVVWSVTIGKSIKGLF